MAFDLPDAQAFVAEPRIGVLAVASDAGPPAATPLWYAYRPGEDLWVVSPASARKVRLLKRSRVATLVVHAVGPRVRYASVDCDLVDARPVTDEERRELASRYLRGDALDAYLEFAVTQLRDELRIGLRPTRWRFADLTGVS